MIRTPLLVTKLLALPPNLDALSRLRSRYLQTIVIFAIVVVAFTNVLAVVTNTVQPTTISNGALAYGVCFSILIMVRLRWLIPASVLLIAIGSLFVITGTNTGFLLAGTFVVITGAALGNRPVYLLSIAIIVGRVLYDVYLALSVENSTGLPLEVRDKMLSVVSLMVMSAATRYFINQAERSSSEARTNASLLQAVAETGEILAKLLNLSTLLPRAVELIQERFGFYHVQVFLLDETNEYASLAASTGATGQKLLERRHRLAVGSKSVIGQVTLGGKPVVARDTDAIYFRNELLPNTRAELALPVMDGDKLIGVLDVQSRRVDAFESESVQALQVMANLLGTSIRNARFFEQQERNARESRRLFLESETNLREIQRLNQQLTNQGWENYLRNRRQINGVTLGDERIVADDNWSEILVKASPQRLALSLDKARLYEESQEATAQEQRINEIVARYQTVSSVDDLLQITLAELSDSLGAKRGAIRLGVGMNSSMNGESQA